MNYGELLEELYESSPLQLAKEVKVYDIHTRKYYILTYRGNGEWAIDTEQLKGLF